MLHRIKEKRSAVLVPIIDVIDDKTFEYLYSKTASDFFQVGGFSWNGHFTWITIPEEEQIRRGSPVAPTRYGLCCMNTIVIYTRAIMMFL